MGSGAVLEAPTFVAGLDDLAMVGEPVEERTQSIDGKLIQNPKWASILNSMISGVKANGFEGEKLVRELGIPAKAADYEDEGYRYYPELGISIQEQSAADAWKEVDRLAKKHRVPVTVEFVWRQNPKAQYPGKAGVLRAGNA